MGPATTGPESKLHSPSSEARAGLMAPVVTCENAGFACFGGRAKAAAEFILPLCVRFSSERSLEFFLGTVVLRFVWNFGVIPGSFARVTTKFRGVGKPPPRDSFLGCST